MPLSINPLSTGVAPALLGHQVANTPCLPLIMLHDSPSSGVAPALLGHQVAKDHRRPKFSVVVPEEYRELASRCWSTDLLARWVDGAVWSRGQGYKVGPFKHSLGEGLGEGQ